MTDEVKRCVESCREWYQAFSKKGKGNEPCVKELLTTADLIESLAAELEQVKQERDGLSIMLTSATSAAEKYKRERDAAVDDITESAPCFACKNFRRNGGGCKGAKSCLWAMIECEEFGEEYTGMTWEWRGVKED